MNNDNNLICIAGLNCQAGYATVLDIEYLISSRFLGRLTIFRKAILKSLVLGTELRLVRKSLPALF
jgi:hypothetical protein